MKLNETRKQELREEVKRNFNKFKEKHPDIITFPIRNSIERIESLGIFVLVAAAPDKVSGFCMTIGEDTFIFINKTHSQGRQNFSLWHEVYHWFTENTGIVSMQGDYNNSEIEFSADYFASLVMIDDVSLERELFRFGYPSKNPKYIKNDEIIQLQHFFEVSYAAMVRRLTEHFPNSNLNSRYGLGRIDRSRELEERTIKLGLNVDLIKPVDETYMSSEVFSLMEILYEQNKITYNKVESLIEFIEKELG